MKETDKFNLKDNNCTIISDGSIAETMLNISEVMASGYVNLDYNDLDIMLKDSQYAVITSAFGEGEHRVTDAINKICNSSVWNEYCLNSAKKLVIKILCAKDSGQPLIVSEMQELVDFTSRLPRDLDIKWALGDDSTVEDKVKLIFLACDFNE